MNQSPHKVINNSYESPSSGSATSSSSIGEPAVNAGFMNFPNNNNGYALSSLLLHTSGADFEMYNTSAEEGIFPNIASNCPVFAPSYEPEYDYYNQYSTTPLVYSWMPIVPGFTQERTDNLHKFDHIIRKMQPQPLNISNVSVEGGNSSILSDQNAKFANSLVLNTSDSKHYILNNSGGMSFNHQLDDSCNAMDLNISCNTIQKESTNLDLSFNGKFPELTTTTVTVVDDEEETNQLATLINEDDDCKEQQVVVVNVETASLERCVNIDYTHQSQDEKNLKENKEEKEEECVNAEESEMDEKLKNESFELLKQEDSTKMLIIKASEKSPEVTETIICDSEYEEEVQDVAVEEEKQSTDLIQEQSETITLDYMKFDVQTETTLAAEVVPKKIPTLKESDDFLLKKFTNSLSGQCPPPSIATLPLSLSEMLAIYKKNVDKPSDTFAPVKTNKMFIPSHPLNETMSMEWPQISEVKAHGVMYNRSTDCEQIEYMTVKYVERYIKTETATSFNHKTGPASAKKKIEKLKLLNQSPSSRLSHLANRRKIFSSANLKSQTTTAATTSHKTFATSKQLLIDKAKLYQKKKRNSAKKKTPGKRKTPKSAKRQSMQLPKPESAASSKRALFISPMKSRNDDNSINAKLSRDIPIRGQLPKRSLFSPPHKRKRSPSPEDENRFGKTRRLDSPSKNLLKSKSFSIAPSTSSGSLDDHFRKTLYYRTQSEVVMNQSAEGINRSASSNNLGFRKPFGDTEKRKLLWSVSSVLSSKHIEREHEKFKEYMATLCKLVRRVFMEFYNPTKSMSAQMSKFATLMVFYVTQGRPSEEIYVMTKKKLEAQNPTRISGYIGQEDYQKNHYIRKNSSLLIMSTSCSSLNLSENNDSILDSTFDKSGSDTSLNRSSSKNNSENNVLRENFLGNARDNSTKKLFSGSDSNINALKTSTPSNVLKAKRQISF